MLFSKANLMVGKVASQNATDLGINCIRLNADGSSVASNGKVLMAVGPVEEEKVHFPDVGPQATPGNQGVSVPLDLLEKTVKNLPKDKRTSLQHVAMTQARDPRKIEFTTTDMRHEQRVAGMPKTDPFPEWKGILQRVRGNSDVCLRVCLNRQSVIDLLHALEEACPDRGGENPVYLEIHPEGKGMILRCINRETGQRAIGGITAYNTNGQWLPADSWETGVLQVQAKRIIRVGGTK